MSTGHSGNFNELPLTYLCQESARPFRIPYRALELLLAAYPQAAAERVGKSQQLALHYAVGGYGVSPRALASLLAANPAGKLANEGRLV